MKYLYLFAIALFILMGFFTTLQAQAPSAIPYQAVARNNSGNLIASQNISLRFSIRDGSAMGTIVYQETQSALTNALGLFSVNIGQGTPVTGTFNGINWAGSSKFMQVELDASGGASYSDMGTQQMLSVPYALYANSGGTPPVAGTGISVTGTTITNTAPDQTVTLTGAGTTTITGTYPNFTVSSTNSGASYTGGTGIDVTGTTITNTAPDQTVTLMGTGATTVSGTYPNFTVNSTDNNTTYTGGTGIHVTGTTIINTSPDQTVTLTGTGATTVTGTYPNFTVNSTDNNTTYTGGTGIDVTGTTITNTAPDQTVTLTGTGATTVTGTYPNFTVNSTDANTTYTGGTGIDVTGTTITNTSPDQPVTLTGTGATTVTGTYPNFTVNSTDANTTYTGGTGINVTGTTITNTSPDQTVTLTGTGATTVTGTYPNFTVNSTDANTTYTGGTGIDVTGTTITNTAPDQTVTLTGAGATTVTGTYPNFTVSSTNSSATYTGGTGIDITGTTITNTAPDQTVTLTGSGIASISGAYPNFTISASETDPQVSATTTNRVPKWNGTALTDGIITDDGAGIGIGTTSPETKLHLRGGSDASFTTGSGYLTIGASTGNNLVFDDNEIMARNNSGESGLYLQNDGGDFFVHSAQGGSTQFSILDNGNVGVGNIAPTQKLDVNGTTKTTNLQITNGATNGYVLQSDASGNASWVSPSILGTNYWTLSSSNLFNNSGTNIGIGTSSPEAKLHIRGGSDASFTTGSGYLTIGASTGSNLIFDDNEIMARDNGNESIMYLQNDGGAIYVHSSQGGNTEFSILDDGKVGIGTIAPVNKLDVNGGMAVGSGYAETSNAPTDGAIIKGDVGIGTNSPVKQLSNTATNVLGNDGNGGATKSIIWASAGNGYTMGLYNSSTNTNAQGLAIKIAGTSASNRILDLSTGPTADDAGTTAMVVKGNGNVGIGTPGPVNKLDIEGGLAVGGTYAGSSTAPTNGAIIQGNVGIGTTSITQAKLVVNGSQSNDLGGFGYLNDNGNTSTSSGTHNYSIYASDRIASSEFNAFSDVRIKNILGVSDSRRDLQTLMGIQITNYKLKDHITKGDREYKKVIAQQVEEVYPQAVTKITDVVPDIYQLAEIRQGYISLANTLHPGDKVKLIFGERSEVTEVIAADAQGFKVNLSDEGKVFVYGRQVDDFRTVDYEALSTLNISATQELVKMLNAQNAEIARLKETVMGEIQQLKAALQLKEQTASTQH